MVTSAALWMAVLARHDATTPSSVRLGRGAACQKCLRILCLIVTILPTDRATIGKHEDMYISKRTGTHERYTALCCTHDERLYEEHPTR